MSCQFCAASSSALKGCEICGRDLPTLAELDRRMEAGWKLRRGDYVTLFRQPACVIRVGKDHRTVVLFAQRGDFDRCRVGAVVTLTDGTRNLQAIVLRYGPSSMRVQVMYPARA